jgi:hypothetical protein
MEEDDEKIKWIIPPEKVENLIWVNRKEWMNMPVSIKDFSNAINLLKISRRNIGKFLSYTTKIWKDND